MSATLNHYRDWLGIETPTAMPSYYELLGLPPLEADTAKIGAAFQRQTQRLAPHISGSEADVAHRLMGELAEARMTLLTPTAKRAYDQALASRFQAATNSPTADELSMISNADAILPPAATSAAGPEPAAPNTAQGYPQPAQAYPQAAPYAAYGPAQPAVAYPSPPYLYHGAQGYPSANYPGWQPQAAPAATGVAYPSSPYYAAPQAATGYATASPVAQPEEVPAVRRTRVRRRSSAAPALAGAAVIVAAVLGGLWLYHQSGKTVAVAGSEEHTDTQEAEKTSPKPNTEREHTAKPPTPKVERSSPKPPPDPVMPSRSVEKPAAGNPAELPQSAKPKPAQPAMTKPQPEPAKPEPPKPELARPETGKPAVPPSETPSEPAEMKANPEERKAVDDALRSVRAALAGRDIAKARDLLAEATIEATADDTLADVNQVEVLTDYLEMFWEAVRKALPKVELEELTIDGKVMNVVEADENHIVVRAEGKNHEYRWQKLPNKLAYYLANRWLAEDDPVRNLVLASFEISEPKGDRANARALLQDATAAGLDAKPLMGELTKAAQSKKS